MRLIVRQMKELLDTLPHDKMKEFYFKTLLSPASIRQIKKTPEMCNPTLETVEKVLEFFGYKLVAYNYDQLREDWKQVHSVLEGDVKIL